MFSFVCTTCESQLAVKNEKLIGKILACPKCGSMVLVPSPDEVPLLKKSPKSTIPKRFPDVLTHETASGVIGPMPKESRRSDLFLEITSPEVHVSDTELKTRKILIGILIGLSVLLLVALGILMLRKPAPPQPPQPSRPVLPIPVERPPPAIPPEPHPSVEEPPELPEPPLPEVPPEPQSDERETLLVEPTPVASDSLSVFERRMPGLLETSVPNIDIAAKLALPILELNFRQQSLMEFVRVMSRLTGVPMTLDIDEMKPLSLSVKTPVTGQFQETTVETVLTETLATVGLQWIATDRQILIVPMQTTEVVDLTFDVSDFAEQTDDLKPEVLAVMIQRLVCPDMNVVVLPDYRLTVRQAEHKPNKKSPRRQQEEIVRFLEQLRVIRQLPQQTEWAGETLAPEAFGWDRMLEPMTLHHYRDVPLSRVVSQLESRTALTILVDHQSLHRALCSFAAVPATVQCDRGTVNDALKQSLASVESAALSYRIIDHQTLEITTAESARQPEKMVVEVHRYQLQEDETPEEMLQALRSAVEPESWSVSEQLGDMVIDPPSGCLLIRQSQPAQQQIRLYFSTLTTP